MGMDIRTLIGSMKVTTAYDATYRLRRSQPAKLALGLIGSC